MNRRSLLAALVVATLFVAGGALAAPLPAASGLALPVVDVATPDALAPDAPVLLATAPAGALAFAEPPPVRRVTILESVRYRPRRYHEPPPPPPRTSSSNGPDGFSQIHAGFLDPDGDERGPGFLAGFRGGVSADEHVVFGGMVDWRHKAEQQSELVSTSTGPGGEPIEVRREFARSSSDLVPVMGFLQLSAGSVPFSPYVGAGAGYEVLWLSAEDFTTGEEFDGTYGGFGWQVWGGISLPLGGSTKLVAEAFANQSEVSRDITDGTGETFRETINLDGTGLRFGFAWGF